MPLCRNIHQAKRVLCFLVQARGQGNISMDIDSAEATLTVVLGIAGLGAIAFTNMWQARQVRSELLRYNQRTMHACEQIARYVRVMALATAPGSRPDGSGNTYTRPSVRAWADIDKTILQDEAERTPPPAPPVQPIAERDAGVTPIIATAFIGAGSSSVNEQGQVY